MADESAQVDLAPVPELPEAPAEAEDSSASGAAASESPSEPVVRQEGKPPSEEMSEEGWQPVKPKRRGRPPGSKNKPKIVALPAEQPEPVEEEDAHEEEPVIAPVRTARYRTKQSVDFAPQPVYNYAPPTFGHKDLGSILSEHFLQVEQQKRLSQQETYARLVRGVLHKHLQAQAPCCLSASSLLLLRV